MSGLRIPQAVMPIESDSAIGGGPPDFAKGKVRFVHSWPTYNLGVAKKLAMIDMDKKTGILYNKDGDLLWLVKGEGLLPPADFWGGDKLMPGWDKTTDWGAYHGAVDIAPDPSGDRAKVRAAFPGEVVDIHGGLLHDSRVLVFTEIGDIRALVIYQHLAPVLLAEIGDRVAPGDLLGHLGAWEGKLAGNEHLHAEVISKKRLPGVDDAYCVPCPDPADGGAANSQFPDDVFREWVELPYIQSNLIACIEAWNKVVSSA